LFFATDVHASEVCWRKFLRCGDFYDTEILILGGDMTGKGLVPIVSEGGQYTAVIQGQRQTFSRDALGTVIDRIRATGFYALVTTADEVAEMEAEPAKVEGAFRRLMLETVEAWVNLADERLDGRKRVLVCPGNDDISEIDEIISASHRLELVDGRVAPIDKGFELVSTAWSNTTPWETHREEDEERLATRIGRILDDVTAPGERLIFNFHCPPWGTPLDEAFALDDDLSVVGGGRETAHVGSHAVREAIERTQPVLTLHGHIHESRAVSKLGRSLTVNPGSAYSTGTLQGFVAELDAKRGSVRRYQFTEG
jgi:Icc-related predicted phosphoesterase